MKNFTGMKKLLSCRTKDKIEAGCDEAGRGCLAGPVVAAAVILPKRFSHPLLNDSKQLSEGERNELRPIIESKALAWSVVFVHEREIEEINILQASLTAMHRAAENLHIVPEDLLIDGNRILKSSRFPMYPIIKGDGIYKSIAAASILAKTHRDEYMEKLHDQYPHYGWKTNKGYPTIEHRKNIVLHGTCEHHRQTFNLLGEFQLELAFED